MFQQQIAMGFWMVFILTGLLIFYLVLESTLHRRRLGKIKYRIHVNGTRGKSSVSRLIAAGLRGGKITTVCKTTGTMARFIYPDGHEEPIIRLGRTNVIEQVKVVKKADKLSPKALVIECMAVQPLLQSLCELKLVRSTHGVMVNAKADHLDVMGPTEADVAKALAGTMTIKGHFFTTERKFLSTFEMAANDRGSEIISISDEAINAISDEEMSQFSYIEYKSNVALALKVCQSIGVDRDLALKGMWQATPDPGALMVFKKTINDIEFTLANGFAANDPESTTALWHLVLSALKPNGDVIALVNCRADRGDRSRQMAQVVNTWQTPLAFFVIGSGTDVFFKHVDKALKEKCFNLEGAKVKAILDKGQALSDKKALLFIGVCNIAGIGFELVNFFEGKEHD